MHSLPPIHLVRGMTVTLLGIAVLTFVLGTAWDVQWHVSVGRDKVLTAPHVAMLAGIALAGLVSLAHVLYESRRRPHDTPRGTLVVGPFRSPPGVMLAGVGALLAALAFPLDDYWHVLYGIDVTLFAPFHVMIVTGVMTVAVGASHTLASAHHHHPHPRTGVAFTVTLALAAATLYLLIPDAAYDHGLVRVGSYDFALYPVAIALTVPAFVLTATRVTRLPFAGTLFAAALLLVKLAMDATVPWLVETVRTAEGLAYRPTAPDIVVSAAYLPAFVLVTAIVVDLAALRGTRPHALAALAVAAVTAQALLERAWMNPGSLPALHPDADMTALLVRALPLLPIAAAASAAWSDVVVRSYGPPRALKAPVRNTVAQGSAEGGRA